MIDQDNTNATAQTEMNKLKSTQMYEQSASESYEKGDFRKVRIFALFGKLLSLDIYIRARNWSENLHKLIRGAGNQLIN